MSTLTTVETVSTEIEKDVEETSMDSEMGQNCPNTSNEKSVTWAQNTIDNEHMNKKSSKSCCIFTGKKSQIHRILIVSPTTTIIKETDSDSDSSEDKKCPNH